VLSIDPLGATRPRCLVDSFQYSILPRSRAGGPADGEQAEQRRPEHEGHDSRDDQVVGDPVEGVCIDARLNAWTEGTPREDQPPSQYTPSEKRQERRQLLNGSAPQTLPLARGPRESKSNASRGWGEAEPDREYRGGQCNACEEHRNGQERVRAYFRSWSAHIPVADRTHDHAGLRYRTEEHETHEQCRAEGEPACLTNSKSCCPRRAEHPARVGHPRSNRFLGLWASREIVSGLNAPGLSLLATEVGPAAGIDSRDNISASGSCRASPLSSVSQFRCHSRRIRAVPPGLVRAHAATSGARP
jgi:hypothetical protein